MLLTIDNFCVSGNPEEINTFIKMYNSKENVSYTNSNYRYTSTCTNSSIEDEDLE